MTSKDLVNDIKELNAFTPDAISTDTTTAGEEIDTQGYESISFILRASSYSDGTYTPLIQGSDTSGSGYANVTDSFLIGTEAGSALAAAGVSKIGAVATYRYYKLSYVSTSTSSGATLDAVAVLGHARHNKVA